MTKQELDKFSRHIITVIHELKDTIEIIELQVQELQTSLAEFYKTEQIKAPKWTQAKLIKAILEDDDDNKDTNLFGAINWKTEQ
jgi:arsenate reductase-like glutaredoxin family protein